MLKNTNYQVGVLKALKTRQILEIGCDFMIKYIDGDCLNMDVQMIAHQTNCMGVMGDGIAKSIVKKYPEINKEYVDLCKESNILGTCQICKTNSGMLIANLFGQDHVSDRTHRATNYIALERACFQLYTYIKEHGVKTITMPYLIGCGLGGGNWKIVDEILNKIFGEDDDFTLYVTKFNK